MEDLPLLRDIALALSLAFAGGMLARFCRLSPIIGYLFAGLVLSPFTPGYAADLHVLQELAEIGVVFLMFGVGLHFNLRDLLDVKGIAIPGAVSQIALTAAIGMGAGGLFGLGWREGLLMGLAVSVASTVVLVRALEERGMLGSVHGRVAIGWLIVEDLAVVFFLVLLPSLSPNEQGSVVQDTAVALLKAALFIGIMFVVGARLVPRILTFVARTGSRELFILAVVAGALGIATGAAAFGLSVALGAFVAGVVISESETSHQAAAEVIPLREAFAVLFFVSVGMIIDPGIVRENLPLLAVVVVIVIVGKAVIALVVTAAFPYPARTGLTVAAGLAQVGEFSFIIAQDGSDLGMVSAATYNVILAAAVVSIMVNPFVFAGALRVEPLLEGVAPLWRLLDRQGRPPDVVLPAERHVVVAGYGRVGELTGHALMQLGQPFVVIESNLDLSQRLVAAGIPTVWGDAARPEILEKAGIGHARAFAVCVPDESTALLALAGALRLNPGLPSIVRARDREEQVELRALGASEVVVPELEGGLEMMRQTLMALGFDPEETLLLSRSLRDEHYATAIASA